MIKVKRSRDGQYYFTIHSAHNGRKLVTSETYKSKQNAKKTADAVAFAMFKHWNENKSIVDETKKN